MDAEPGEQIAVRRAGAVLPHTRPIPRAQDEIKPDTVADLARQLGIGLAPAKSPAVSGRTVERHRAEIRTLLGFREMTVADGEVLTEWLRDHAVADNRDTVQLAGTAEQRCRDLGEV